MLFHRSENGVRVIDRVGIKYLFLRIGGVRWHSRYAGVLRPVENRNFIATAKQYCINVS